MIVYAIKNKDNEYLYIDEWQDIYFYDEVYLATLFGNKLDAETFLKEKFESYSDGVKNIINSMKDDNTIIYSKNYDISVSLKANILNKIKIDIL